jgi:hypothetical protein
LKKKVACSARIHDWDHEPAGPGSICKACGKKYGENPPGWKPWSKKLPVAASGNTGNPPPAMSTSSPAAGPDLSRLAAKWAPSAQPAAQPAGQQDAAAQPPEKKPGGKGIEFFAVPLADMSILGVGKVQQWLGRQPGEPDPEWMERYRVGVTDTLKKYLPNTEVGPVSRAVGSFLILSVDMWTSGKPKETEAPRLVSVPAAPRSSPAPEEPEQARPPLRLVKPEEQACPPNATVVSPAGAPSSASSSRGSSPSSSDLVATSNMWGIDASGSAPGAEPGA